MLEEYYNKLHLKPPVSDAEIREAYRHLAKVYHPDGSGTPQTREKFQEITRAYRILKNRRTLWQQQFITFYLKLKQLEEQEKQPASGAPPAAHNHPQVQPQNFTRTGTSVAERIHHILYSSVDYCFLLLCAVMLIFPFFRLMSTKEYYWQPGNFLPAVVGLLFAGLCLYFSFWLPRKRRNHP